MSFQKRSTRRLDAALQLIGALLLAVTLVS